MKPLILVIGSTKAGKSTIISSLTGCKNHSYKGEVKDKSTKKEIYVICSSPQEENAAKNKYKKALDDVPTNSHVIALVVAARATRYLETIISDAQDTEEFNIYPFLITSGYDSTNTHVDQALAIFQRRNIKHYVLDGRRFAFLNAAKINKITGIPN